MTMHALKRTVTELGKGEKADLSPCDNLVPTCLDIQSCIESRHTSMEKRRPIFRGHRRAKTTGRANGPNIHQRASP